MHFAGHVFDLFVPVDLDVALRRFNAFVTEHLRDSYNFRYLVVGNSGPAHSEVMALHV
jgi:hypothetical protein